MTPIDQWIAQWGNYIPAHAIDQLRHIVTYTHELQPRSPLTISEQAVQQYLRVHAPKNGHALWRNNRGAMMNPDTGNMVRFGLGNDSVKLDKVWKSSDLIGIGPGGKFMAIEVKHPGWTGPKNDRERAQANFLQSVRGLGGLATFATRIEDYERLISNVKTT